MTEPAPVSRKKKVLSILTTLAVFVVLLFLLAAIATPKFIKFGCKSNQSEAKTNLAGIFTSEKAFFGEYQFYTTDLVSLNWTPDGSPAYVYGFAAPSSQTTHPDVPELDPTRRTTLDSRVAGPGYRITKMKTLSGRVFSDDDFQRLFATATATSGAFVAVAIGDVDEDGSEEKLDVWTIDQARELRVVANDCTD